MLFVNAVNKVTRERAQSFLEDDHIARIVAVCADFAEAPGFAHVAKLDQIRLLGEDLSIPVFET
jgi:type I restriction enzyme M protein